MQWLANAYAKAKSAIKILSITCCRNAKPRIKEAASRHPNLMTQFSCVNTISARGVRPIGVILTADILSDRSGMLCDKTSRRRAD